MAASSVVSSSPFNDLADQFDGEVILPGAPDYDARRAVWNGMIDRRPACIARCKSVRRRPARGAVRASQQSARSRCAAAATTPPGSRACDGGLVIDLARYARRRRRSGAQRTARPAAARRGASSIARPRRTASRRPAARSSTTGIAGLTLGGGLGWLMRSYGLACDNIIGADVVTADGQAAARERDGEPDLFWGAARRRRKFWRRHDVRIPAAPGVDDSRRHVDLSARAGARRAASLSRRARSRRPTRSRCSPR